MEEKSVDLSNENGRYIIDALPKRRKYRGRDFWGAAGLNPVIAPIDDLSRQEMGIMREIDESVGVMKWMIGDPESDLGLKDTVNFHSDEIRYGVFGSKEVTANEFHKMLGWILFYTDDDSRTSRLKELKLVSQNAEIWDTSFAKRETAPKGNMFQGLMLACCALADDFGSDELLTITAWVAPENKKSIDLLLKAGYELRADLPYENNSKKNDLLFILNWEKLSNILRTAGGLEQKLGIKPSAG